MITKPPVKPNAILKDKSGTLTETKSTEQANPVSKQLALSRSESSRSFRTQMLIENNCVSFDPKLSVFIVKGTSQPRVITVFPHETCSCPAKSNCYHILAVRKSLGLTVAKEKLINRNLSQLRKNTRAKKEKRCGRKRPRPKDVDGMLLMYYLIKLITIYYNA